MSLSLLALLLMTAAPDPHAATPGRPAQLRPAMAPGADCAADPQLTVALTRFAPPRRGHATLIVSLRTGDGRTTELGQVGVYPEQPFAGGMAGAMRFGFAVPRAALRAHPTVVVRIVSDGGPGAGGRAVIGAAVIGPAPGESC